MQSEGKYVVKIGEGIPLEKLVPNTRVALRNDSYTLHKILPTKVRPSLSALGLALRLHSSPN
jgi:26S proteasome regulatory subunit T6